MLIGVGEHQQLIVECEKMENMFSELIQVNIRIKQVSIIHIFMHGTNTEIKAKVMLRKLL